MIARGTIAALVLASAALAAETAAATAGEAGPLSAGGGVEIRPFSRWTESGGSSYWSSGSFEDLGLDLDAKGDRARAAASLEATVLEGQAAADAWEAAPSSSSDLLLVPAFSAGAAAPATLVEARVRTLYVKLDWDWASLTAGRQVVNYLRGALWSPTDVFTELDLSGLLPVRRGTDAVRLTLPIGETGAADLVSAPADRPDEGRYAARVSGFVLGLDGALLGYRGGEARTWNLGGDFKFDLGPAWNCELLWSRPDSGAPWLRAAGGADWSFGDFIVAAEYYYNGGGAAADSNAPGLLNAYGVLTWRESDFVEFSASCIDGVSAGTSLSTLGATISAAQNATVTVYARLGWGGSGSTRTAETGLDLRVDF
jgi:hypothetical protein